MEKLDRSYWREPNAAHRRVMYKGAGYSDSDIKTKPHIGVANSFMEGSPGSAHLRQLAEGIKQGIWQAGGVPIEFGLPATCGNLSNGAEELKFELVGRDVVAASVEFVTQVHHFDGLVMIASCDNIIAGAYLAAARMNLPALVVTGGSMMPGRYQGKTVLAPDVDVAILKGDDEDLSDMEECVCPSFGACSVMGTANTMQILGEALNLVMPGTATIPAPDLRKFRSARTAGNHIVGLVKGGVKPSDLITRETLLNTIMVDMAIGGSTNAVLHIISIARELDIDLTLDDFESLSREIRCICGVRPNGPYNVVDLHNEGGVPAVMKMLEHKLYTSVPTLVGNTWKDVLARVAVEPGELLSTLDKPLHKEAGLKVLKGNLAPKGAIIRPSGVSEEMKYFRGSAKVFGNDFDSLKAIQAGEIKPGDVIVIRYEGCKGAPGMKELMLSTDALVAFGLHKSVGLVTDARFSGFNYGAIVGHICPEAYDGGPIALVENGDVITVDVAGGIVSVDLSEEELAKRRAEWVRPAPKVTKGVLALYAATCRTADEGGAMQTW